MEVNGKEQILSPPLQTNWDTPPPIDKKLSQVITPATPSARQIWCIFVYGASVQMGKYYLLHKPLRMTVVLSFEWEVEISPRLHMCNEKNGLNTIKKVSKTIKYPSLLRNWGRRFDRKVKNGCSVQAWWKYGQRTWNVAKSPRFQPF